MPKKVVIKLTLPMEKRKELAEEFEVTLAMIYKALGGSQSKLAKAIARRAIEMGARKEKITTTTEVID